VASRRRVEIVETVEKATTKPTLLQLVGVERTFGPGRHPFVALKDISVDVAQGEFVSLVGPSGCGKSTLLKIVAGLMPATNGEVLIGDEAVVGPRRDVGLMFQTATLFPWRTVVRNITLPLDIMRDRTVDRNKRVREVIELVGLQGFENHYPRELSGGMQQRVALCRLLISDPALMLLDEPFGSLDEFTRERLNLELARISEYEHKTTVFVTHNIPEATFLSDRIVVMGTAPGRVLDVVDVTLPRPRRAGMLTSPEFSECVAAVRRVLGLG
jgi:NitT/TauT family transport system ATP-binding protein